MEHYTTTFTDRYGIESTTISNDGETIRLTLRGIEFAGCDFDDFEPPWVIAPIHLEKFDLNRGSLCSCRIECEIPVTVNDHGQLVNGILLVDLILVDPDSKGGLDRIDLALVLKYGECVFASPGKSNSFEGELIGIQEQLPAGVYIKSCINCLYSDYSPYGHGLFGHMMCFRNVKKEYLKVTNKTEFWGVHDRHDRMVQETYLCPEFERRVPGTGYRG